jgi:hypothetical protein
VVFNAIGRFLKRMWKSLKKAAKKRAARKAAKKAAKKSKKASKKGFDAPASETPIKETAGFKAVKLVTLTVIASAIFYFGFAATPIGIPVMSALGGEIARTATEIWST